jgi:transcription antitermination factor NusG
MPQSATREQHSEPGRWFAIHTRSRHEKLVARQLGEKDFETFLPLRLEVHRWRDRWQKVEVPLFGGYLFAHYDGAPPRRFAILRTPGVVRIVGFGGREEPVPDEQMQALRRMVAHDGVIERHRFLRAGQRVRIINGSLAGVEGILARVKGRDRLVLNIAPLRQAVSIELSGYEVVPIGV